MCLKSLVIKRNLPENEFISLSKSLVTTILLCLHEFNFSIFCIEMRFILCLSPYMLPISLSIMFSSFINVDNDIVISFFWKVWVVDFGCLQGSFHALSSADQALTQINSVSWPLWRVLQKTLETRHPSDVLITIPVRYLLHSDTA